MEQNVFDHIHAELAAPFDPLIVDKKEEGDTGKDGGKDGEGGGERGRGDEGVTPNLIDFFDDKTKIEVAKESNGDGLLLDSIWRSLLPGEGKVMSKSKLWTSVGFQGINPATDIRGGGRLSVLCLEHFAAHYSDAYVHGCLFTDVFMCSCVHVFMCVWMGKREECMIHE